MRSDPNKPFEEMTRRELIVSAVSRAGQAAFKAGAPIGSNPYAPHHPKFQLWNHGWRLAYLRKNPLVVAPIKPVKARTFFKKSIDKRF